MTLVHEKHIILVSIGKNYLFPNTISLYYNICKIYDGIQNGKGKTKANYPHLVNRRVTPPLIHPRKINNIKITFFIHFNQPPLTCPYLLF